ncbi:DctP family TRAP transporter solute-binding subunit [Brevibacterium album]|uniref:DctP family TRAP transporter solute-binding subunit n=1 Tax=Brevibacterium album TaxID=417948 RepID=UPI0003F8DBA7|nr:DctP family TRAP transporter solute-binding subunit [Brevibacterium album]
MRRKTLTALAAGASALALSGCSLMQPVDISGFAAEAPDPDATVVRLANVYEPGHPANTCGTATMREELAQDGIDLKVYPAAQLGGEPEIIEQVATGALDIGISGGSFFGAWYPDAEVVDGAFLVDNSREYDRATRGPLLTRLYDDMAEETGLRVFSSWYYGARNVTANKPVRSPEDLRGLKIRTPDAALYLETIRALGGTATPMALSEVYLGLQQGAIDAQENPIPTIASNKFEEVQSTVSITRHMVQGVQLVTSENFMEGLSEGERTAVLEAADAARLANLKCIEDEEREILEQWRAEGTIEIVEDIDAEAFRQGVKENLLPAKEWGDLYLEVQEEIAADTPTVVGTDPEDSPVFADGKTEDES